ncbi:P-loop containing nucleoside triphosphate hydrolase protein, partial [Viridothelium virens]
YCMVATRWFDLKNKYLKTTLEIKSPALINALRTLVPYYPDNTSLHMDKTIKVEDPPALIYHYRNELHEYAQAQDVDAKTKLHISYVLRYLATIMGEQIEEFNTHLDHGLIDYKNLWMIFRSGGWVYQPGKDQLYFFEQGAYGMTDGVASFDLKCHMVNYDGKNVGLEQTNLCIHKYEYPRDITALPVYPLNFHGDPKGLKRRLISRAQAFLELRGVQAREHKTIGRMMIDCKTYQERKPISVGAITLTESCKCVCPACRGQVVETVADYDHGLRVLSENEMLMCTSRVCGFSLSSHDWVQVFITDLNEVQWSTNAMEKLVMDEKQKKVILSLVTSPVFTEGTNADIVGWKGKGLVTLLHGPPGTGKTLTAEVMSEHLHRPLYVVDGGELGTDAVHLEKNLRSILELSKRWQAIILIDEADVFLEQRRARDIKRNNLVSVFLRRLEYFEGILFLTTNRVEHFDDAFASRIHLALNYPELEPWMRREIWINAISRFPADESDIGKPAALDELSNVVLNGRVISYAVRTAKALADAEGKKMGVSHLWDVVRVYQKFNGQFKGEAS